MSGSRKCPRCGLLYIGRDVAACWYCLNGYDPRGPARAADEEDATRSTNARAAGEGDT